MDAAQLIGNCDEIIKHLIQSIDLEPVIERMVKIHKWPRSHAIEAAAQYRRFLFLNKKYGNTYPLPPSRDIDEFWHNHILHTYQYQKDSQKIFNEFFHHYPSELKNNESQKHTFDEVFEKHTQMLHFKEFGDYIYEIRPTSIFGKLIEHTRLLYKKRNKSKL
jgi:hypothetical protein